MITLIILIFLFLPNSVALAEESDVQDWDFCAHTTNDSLCVSATTSNTKIQLTALMQGLTLKVQDKGISFSFPSAPMVRSKLKRHPNEVKAMMRRDNAGEEVKPDLQPLIQALSDTVGVMVDSLNKQYSIRSFKFLLDKENAKLTFSVKLPLTVDKDSIELMMSSAPGNLYDRKEFTGRRLSCESSPSPNGLGEAPMKKDDRNRTFTVKKIVTLSDCEKCEVCYL